MISLDPDSGIYTNWRWKTTVSCDSVINDYRAMASDKLFRGIRKLNLDVFHLCICVRLCVSVFSSRETEQES